ncbi:MAG: hypothetical protein Q8L40_11240, partial [Burkholderiales bacterium]|nr:hypothetical protein [Burkholderiales bacterium]
KVGHCQAPIKARPHPVTGGAFAFAASERSLLERSDNTPALLNAAERLPAFPGLLQRINGFSACCIAKKGLSLFEPSTAPVWVNRHSLPGSSLYGTRRNCGCSSAAEQPDVRLSALLRGNTTAVPNNFPCLFTLLIGAHALDIYWILV